MHHINEKENCCSSGADFLIFPNNSLAMIDLKEIGCTCIPPSIL